MDNMTLMYMINGVIWWGIGIDTSDTFAKVIGVICVVISAVLNLYSFYKRM